MASGGVLELAAPRACEYSQSGVEKVVCNGFAGSPPLPPHPVDRHAVKHLLSEGPTLQDRLTDPHDHSLLRGALEIRSDEVHSEDFIDVVHQNEESPRGSRHPVQVDLSGIDVSAWQVLFLSLGPRTTVQLSECVIPWSSPPRPDGPNTLPHPRGLPDVDITLDDTRPDDAPRLPSLRTQGLARPEFEGGREPLQEKP
eukprot:scaffold1277_cov253-Pinguiococcus_pyrenoidosus.AAC.1